MVAALRYPPPANWDGELDAHDRAFEAESWQDDPPYIIRLDDHLSADAARERLAQLDRLAASGTFVVLPQPREPLRHGWFSTLLVPIAVLCVVGLLLGAVG